MLASMAFSVWCRNFLHRVQCGTIGLGTYIFFSSSSEAADSGCCYMQDNGFDGTCSEDSKEEHTFSNVKLGICNNPAW